MSQLNFWSRVLVFGKIDYLNLLPFHIFMKRRLRFSQQKQSMEYHKGVPSKINKKFLEKKVDAAFISSVNSRKCKNPKVGIVANKRVLSVLLIPSKDFLKDSESATSNVLAKILNLKGEVIIGDKALVYYLQNDKATFIDLAQRWYEKYSLPFVFATFCTNQNTILLQKIQDEFVLHVKSIKIPYYLLQRASKRTKIPPKEIVNYLEFISYKIDKKEILSLKKFLAKAKQKVK